MEPINPEALAIMLARSEADAHRKEMLWFIQSRSVSGGIKRLATEMLGECPERLGTATMHRLKGKNKYTVQECIAIWREVPQYMQSGVFRDWRVGVEMEIIEDERESVRTPDELREQIEGEILKHNKADFESFCRKHAIDELQYALAAMCRGDVEAPEVWCFQGIRKALEATMKAHAQRASACLAKTAVAREVFDALDYAWSEKVLVQIEGDSRFGKTEAIETWCRMHPGRARLVPVPCSNSDGDLYKAVADSIGVPYAPTTRSTEIKSKVEYIVRHSGLFIIFDEAHWLIPSRYSVGTPPMRLNWIRTELVDKDVPVALVTTPQSFHGPLKQFIKKTGYTIEQFLGRIMLKKKLPSELDEADLIAVARIHFPEMDEDLLGLIAAKAMQSEGFLQTVEGIAKRARYLAKHENKAAVTLEHVDRAIADHCPGPIQPPDAAHLKPLLKPVATPLKRGGAALISRRRGSDVGRFDVTVEPDLADV